MKKSMGILLSVLMVSTMLTGCLAAKPSTAPAGEQKTTAPAPASTDKKDKKVIKISIGLNEKSHEYKALEVFKKEVESKTDGRYDIQIYANAQLGDDVKATTDVKMGTLEMTGPSSSALTGMLKDLMVFDLPFIFPNAQVAYKVMDGPIGQKILDNLASQGIKGLAYYENGFRQLTNSVREVKTPDDVKGLKIRTMENPIHLAAWKALGANPTPMPFSEVFTAMQQKTIDGQENPVLTIYDSKFNEVQKYLTLTGHVYTPHLLLMNKKLFDSMPAADQKIFQDAAYAGRDYVRKLSAELTDSYATKLKEAGMTVTKLDAQQTKAFQDKVKPIYDQFADKIGKDLLDEVVKEVEKNSK
jgi:TRAP-type transport system periplasmic protein